MKLLPATTMNFDEDIKCLVSTHSNTNKTVAGAEHIYNLDTPITKIFSISLKMTGTNVKKLVHFIAETSKQSEKACNNIQ